MRTIFTLARVAALAAICYSGEIFSAELRDYSLPSERRIRAYDARMIRPDYGRIKAPQPREIPPYTPRMIQLKEKLAKEVRHFDEKQLNQLQSQYRQRFEHSLKTADARQAKFFNEMREIVVCEIKRRGGQP